ncbi:MAG: 30S ribosomal protein S3ae [Thermoplasmata archaeon]
MAEKESSPKKTTLTRTVKDKWRSKKTYKVRAPGIFQHAEIGETIANEPEQIIGRTLETTFQELSGGADAGKAHIKLRFQIERVTGDGFAEARFVGHDLTSDYIRRLARRKRSKIDLALRIVTQDGVAIILKPVAVGEQRLQANLRAKLRGKMVEVLKAEAQSKPAATFVREMLQGELTKTLAQGVKTLYPLKKIEIRRSIVLAPIADLIVPADAPAGEAVVDPSPEKSDATAA